MQSLLTTQPTLGSSVTEPGRGRKNHVPRPSQPGLHHTEVHGFFSSSATVVDVTLTIGRRATRDAGKNRALNMQQGGVGSVTVAPRTRASVFNNRTNLLHPVVPAGANATRGSGLPNSRNGRANAVPCNRRSRRRPGSSSPLRRNTPNARRGPKEPPSPNTVGALELSPSLQPLSQAISAAHSGTPSLIP